MSKIMIKYHSSSKRNDYLNSSLAFQFEIGLTIYVQFYFLFQMVFYFQNILY